MGEYGSSRERPRSLPEDLSDIDTSYASFEPLRASSSLSRKRRIPGGMVTIVAGSVVVLVVLAVVLARFLAV